MTDIRFIHANGGRVLTIEVGGTAYTPEEVQERLAEWDRSEEEATRWAVKCATLCEALKLERAELSRLRAALIRWRDADGTMAFPDADEELATIARELGNE